MELLRSTDMLFGCDSPDSFTAQLAHDPGSILVAVLDKAVVGCIFVLFNPLLTGFYHLVVDPRDRQLGLGAALLAAAEDQSRQRGAAAFCAYIYEGNEPSLRLVQRYGYHADEHPVICVSRMS
jgi:GNAT superfamily N-acetyltransferase